MFRLIKKWFNRKKDSFNGKEDSFNEMEATVKSIVNKVDKDELCLLELEAEVHTAFSCLDKEIEMTTKGVDEVVR